MIVNFFLDLHHSVAKRYIVFCSQETTEERVEQECPYLLFYELEGIKDRDFRAKLKSGKKAELGRTEDDKEFEEEIGAKCVIS